MAARSRRRLAGLPVALVASLQLAGLMVVGLLGASPSAVHAQDKPEQAKPETAQPEQAQPEQAQPEQAQPEQAQPETPQTASEAASTKPETAPPPATATPATKPDSGTYQVRLRDLERQVGELKEQVFRSKSRLALLAESVLQGVVAGSQARIVHQDHMSSTYKLVRAVYALDGAPVLDRADEQGLLAGRSEFQVFNGSIAPGEHILTVNLEYRGDGYGMFNYMKGYRFTVRSSYSFTAPAARVMELRVIGHEKGGPIVPVEERPAVRFAQRIVNPKAMARRETSAK